MAGVAPPFRSNNRHRLVLMLRQIECVAKMVWNHPATGWFILFGLAVACLAFWIWPQPAGYAVTILGGVAAVMTLRELEHTQKVLLTLAIFALVGIELRNIRTDRAETERQFEATMKRSDAIMTKANEAVAFASGGHSFPVVFPAVVTQANGMMKIGFYLSKQGSYPLYALTAFVGRPYKASEANQTRTTGTSLKLSEYNQPTSFAILFEPLPREEVAYYTASMSARNGPWEEVIEARRVGPKIFLRWTVFGQSLPGVTPDKQLVDLADSGFPTAERHIPIYPLNIQELPPYGATTRQARR